MRIISAIFIGLFLSACSASFPSSGVVGEYDGLWTGELTGDKSFCQGLRFTGEIRYSFLIGTITQKGRDRGQISGPVAANGVLSSVDKIGFSGGNSVVQFNEDTAKGVWSRFSCSGQINLHRVGSEGAGMSRRDEILRTFESRLPICERDASKEMSRSSAKKLCKCGLEIVRDNMSLDELELLDSITDDDRSHQISEAEFSVVGKFMALRSKVCGF
jgi:hypothetical protein